MFMLWRYLGLMPIKDFNAWLHHRSIVDLALISDQFIVSSHELSIIIWNFNTIEIISTYRLQRSPVYLNLISNNRLAFGFKDGTIYIINDIEDKNTMITKTNYKHHEQITHMIYCL
jgi:WD40 repeat protein